MTDYAELAVATNFSFLRGASRPEELMLQAGTLGLAAIGIADRNSLAGVVRALAAHRQLPDTARPRLLVGARLAFADGTPDILAYPADREAYAGLCRLLTLGQRRAKKGACEIGLLDLEAHAEGLLLAVVPPRGAEAKLVPLLRQVEGFAPGRTWLAAAMLYRGDDRRRLAALKRAAGAAGVPLLATNDVLYHAPERRPLQDVLACVREKTTIEAAGRLLQANAERHLKPAAEMARLFRDAPEAVAETLRFAKRITFSLRQLAYDYPDEPVPPGKTPQAHLEDLTWAGAAWRYPDGVPPDVRDRLRDELKLIEELGYAPYFLTVHDIVRQANGFEPPILCQGRGSAANSAVCFVLGVTAVDPAESNLLFARFLSKERREPPDIDIDFEHERREEVIQDVYRRYGRDRAALTGTVISYRPRSAIRDVGKALGLTEDVTAALADTVWGSWGDGISEAQIRQAGLDPSNPSIKRAVELALQLVGFPRHLSQHVGGFVLTKRRLDETVPIGNAAMPDRTFIEWDKDDIDELGIMKVDVLALGMLTCIRKAFDLTAAHEGKSYTLANIPRSGPEADAVFDMLCRGESLGVFQVESRAQMNMLPRLKPRCFYDLVIEVAIVRPGPIQGDMVHPYLKRRQEQEKDPSKKIVFPKPAPEHGPPDELEKVLGRTLGVPLFQEQAMELAIVAAQFTPDEANALRKSMATFRHVGGVDAFRDRFVGRMTARGYPHAFAERCFKQIEGFGSYGFPESHAASFARLVWVSSWIKHFHPAAFACALLNSQPMGFYAPAQIVRDARENGVEVRPVEVNASCWDNTLEPGGADGRPALRLGFRQIGAFREDWARAIEARRGAGFDTVEAVMRWAALPKQALLLLADADGFGSLGLDRRAALWAARRLPNDDALPLFAAAAARELGPEPDMALPATPLAEDVVADYQSIRLSLKAHPMQFLRGLFSAERAVTCRAVGEAADGRALSAAGVVLVRQRPGSSKGVVFMTIEDETGIANVVVWPKLFERFRREVMGARLLLVVGRVQRSPEGVVHLVAERLVDRSHELARLSERSLSPPLANADEVKRPQADRRPSGRHPRDNDILPRSRDFH
jgi:error-prone DNA polymerase